MSIRYYMPFMRKRMASDEADRMSPNEGGQSGDAERRATRWRKYCTPIWRILRPVLLAYSLILFAMLWFEPWLVYPAPPINAGDWHPTEFKFEDIWFQSGDGTKLHGWFLPTPGSKLAVLYCHGNGEDVAAIGSLAAMLRQKLTASIFIFDYRGYGHSKGRPNEAGCIADGNAALHWLAQRLAVEPKSIVLMGRSLGSAVAIALAAENGAKALVIENAFTTMPEVAALHYRWLPVRWVMSNRYDNLARIKRYTGPLLQSHGSQDDIIPLALPRRLFDAAPSENKKWLQFTGLGHNSAPPESYYDELANFLHHSAD
jgi:uncharacterized protein